MYAGGRPLWHLSLSVFDPKKGRSAPVLSWSPTRWREMEAMRDKIMRGVGTAEPFIGEDPRELDSLVAHQALAMQWRKPLSIMEINRMAPTSEVRERQGRP